MIPLRKVCCELTLLRAVGYGQHLACRGPSSSLTLPALRNGSRDGEAPPAKRADPWEPAVLACLCTACRPAATCCPSYFWETNQNYFERLRRNIARIGPPVEESYAKCLLLTSSFALPRSACPMHADVFLTVY